MPPPIKSTIRFLQTSLWINHVKKSAGVDTAYKLLPSKVRNGIEDLSWYKYEGNTMGVGKSTITKLESAAPGSQEIFDNGPGGVVIALKAHAFNDTYTLKYNRSNEAELTLLGNPYALKDYLYEKLDQFLSRHDIDIHDSRYGNPHGTPDWLSLITESIECDYPDLDTMPFVFSSLLLQNKSSCKNIRPGHSLANNLIRCVSYFQEQWSIDPTLWIQSSTLVRIRMELVSSNVDGASELWPETDKAITLMGTSSIREIMNYYLKLADGQSHAESSKELSEESLFIIRHLPQQFMEAENAEKTENVTKK